MRMEKDINSIVSSVAGSAGAELLALLTLHPLRLGGGGFEVVISQNALLPFHIVASQVTPLLISVHCLFYFLSFYMCF